MSIQETQATERSKCENEQAKRVDKPLSESWQLKQCVISITKCGLKYLLMRPKTWKWLIQHLPDALEKVDLIIKNIISFFDQ